MNSRSFLVADSRLRNRMLNEGKKVHPMRWQGVDVAANAQAEMVELLNVDLEVDLRGIESLEHWRTEIQPNLPWADRHFEERVCGEPINPGTEWENWPWAKSAGGFVKGGLFNHNYMERYWPKIAGFLKHPTKTVSDFRQVLATASETPHELFGIRHTYGDLNDVVELLRRDPLTRQAYLPIFFPEDTGVGDGARKPCTLGYQFIVRDNLLHIYYPMRSCDLLRHFRDDCYLTVRLGIWMLEQLRERSDYAQFWSKCRLGTYSMHMTSLHCFIGDYMLMRHETEKALESRLMEGL